MKINKTSETGDDYAMNGMLKYAEVQHMLVTSKEGELAVGFKKYSSHHPSGYKTNT